MEESKVKTEEGETIGGYFKRLYPELINQWEKLENISLGMAMFLAMKHSEQYKSHITKLEQQISDLETALIITKNSRKYHIEKKEVLGAENKRLLDLIDSIRHKVSYEKIVQSSIILKDVWKITEQALNKK